VCEAFALNVLCLLNVLLAAASSPPSRPLTQISRPSIHALEILSRKASLQRRLHSWPSSSSSPIPADSPRLEHTDSFRLTLSAFGEKHYLHLNPVDDLLHPSARINYYKNGPDGTSVLDHTEALLPQSVKVYSGDVLHPDASDMRVKEDSVGGFVNSKAQRLGWARIIVHSQGDVGGGTPPLIEGAFTVNGITHHIMPKEKYILLKHPHDPHPDTNDRNDSSLVIFRDSDLEMEPSISSSLTRGRSSCSHDNLDWNSDPWLNPSLRRPSHPPPTWGLGSDLARSLGLWKRDDVAGGSGDSKYVADFSFQNLLGS